MNLNIETPAIGMNIHNKQFVTLEDKEGNVLQEAQAENNADSLAWDGLFNTYQLGFGSKWWSELTEDQQASNNPAQVQSNLWKKDTHFKYNQLFNAISYDTEYELNSTEVTFEATNSYVGTLKEIQIIPDYNSMYFSRADLQDIEGNPIYLTKTNENILKAKVKIYITFTFPKNLKNNVKLFAPEQSPIILQMWHNQPKNMKLTSPNQSWPNQPNYIGQNGTYSYLSWAAPEYYPNNAGEPYYLTKNRTKDLPITNSILQQLVSNGTTNFDTDTTNNNYSNRYYSDYSFPHIIIAGQSRQTRFQATKTLHRFNSPATFSLRLKNSTPLRWELTSDNYGFFHTLVLAKTGIISFPDHSILQPYTLTDVNIGAGDGETTNFYTKINEPMESSTPINFPNIQMSKCNQLSTNSKVYIDGNITNDWYFVKADPSKNPFWGKVKYIEVFQSQATKNPPDSQNTSYHHWNVNDKFPISLGKVDINDCLFPEEFWTVEGTINEIWRTNRMITGTYQTVNLTKVLKVLNTGLRIGADWGSRSQNQVSYMLPLWHSIQDENNNNEYTTSCCFCPIYYDENGITIDSYIKTTQNYGFFYQAQNQLCLDQSDDGENWTLNVFQITSTSSKFNKLEMPITAKYWRLRPSSSSTNPSTSLQHRSYTSYSTVSSTQFGDFSKSITYSSCFDTNLNDAQCHILFGNTLEYDYSKVGLNFLEPPPADSKITMDLELDIPYKDENYIMYISTQQSFKYPPDMPDPEWED